MTNSLWQNALFNICFPVGLIFIFAGLLMFYLPPKKINSLYGYRTTSSMKNQDRWNFAQRLSAIEMLKLGAFLMLTSLLPLFTNFSNSLSLIIGVSLTLIGLTLLFVKVEKAIKRKFSN
ncbi:SdpI family protein [Kaistella antarctica]|uniref:Predicted integral membrane protein n=1 Tax=Kaistella antarctica TaxID=266748 RepID=A0A448NQV7_9FLAO|nr:SdpI family protein [Kaistella antarctica]KEY19005.1 hypothetical protein HY04_11195 [Kaistella antarctica]SEW12774.1 SdpI/YhfL protein family protein [Kaistella antarctica]VEH99088.1 Predicted integral membrane protein [Kaistella antarctica]